MSDDWIRGRLELLSKQDSRAKTLLEYWNRADLKSQIFEKVIYGVDGDKGEIYIMRMQ